VTEGSTPDPIAFWARARPDRIALRQKDNVWTYRRLEEAVSRIAYAFEDEGMVSGEHVSIEFEAAHSFHFALTLHALHRVGLLPVLIDPRLAEAERIELRHRATVDFALTTSPERVEELGSAQTILTEPPRIERHLGAPAAICFTSGTEGRPHAVVLTHGNFLWGALASGRNLGVHANDVWLSCLPLQHVGGLSVLTRSAYYGTAVLIHDRFDAEQVNQAIDREGVTLLSLVPPMLARLLAARGERPFPRTLRAALIGGGPVPPELLHHAARLRLRALPTYGLTEATSQVATLSPRAWPEGLHTCGKPLPFVHVEIRDAEGRALKPGEEGEIAVQGPTVSQGYFDEPGESVKLARQRWLMTGDIGTWDEAGRLIVLDRRTDRIVVGGENVSPKEVEQALGQNPAVAEICVVALPAAEWGHEIAAAVTLRPGAALTLDELRAFGSQKLAPFKLPRRLCIVESLPRNAGGKLLRPAIRSWFLAQMAQEDQA